MSQLPDNVLQLPRKMPEYTVEYVEPTKQPDNYNMEKGGVKYDNGRARFDLIPVMPLYEVAKLYEVGARKYTDRNWEKGMRWGRCFAAMIRHAFKWWWGSRYDDDNGQHHLASVVFYAFALMEYEVTYPEGDDRSKQCVANAAPGTTPDDNLRDVYGLH